MRIGAGPGTNASTSASPSMNKGPDAEQFSYTRVALSPPFDIMRATLRQHRFVPHAHEEYAIGVVESGRGLMRHAHGVNEHPAGSVIIIPPGLAHEGAVAHKDGMSYRMLYLPACYLIAASQHNGFPPGTSPCFDRIAITDAELAERIVAIHADLEAAHIAPEALLPTLDAVLDDLVRRHAMSWSRGNTLGATASPGLRQVRRFLDASFTRQVSVNEMSRIAGLSSCYLIRAFRRAYGLPPYTYLEQLRVQHARGLIETGVGISAAAAASGFSDQSHLTRRFKRTLGITPGVIARRRTATPT